MIARTTVLLTAFLLSGCATASEPKVVTKEVKVEVVRPCVPKDVPAPPPSYADQGQEKRAPEDRYVAIAQANQQRRARLATIEPVIAGCR